MSWSNMKHTIVSLSLTKAMYKALYTVSCEAIWLKRILEDMGENQEKPTIMWQPKKITTRSKHIETHHHFVK